MDVIGLLAVCFAFRHTRAVVGFRHFLIQVTNANIRNEPYTTAVSKVTVLIRGHNCTRSLHYEASSDEETLPISFVDGLTHYNADDRRTTVEIRANGDYVEIAMHHIHSSIHIRRRGPYLSVTVLVPENLQRSSPSSESLCTTGCRNRSIIAIDKALAASNQFAKCYSRKIHVPMKLAIDRCRTIQVTDQYFDACVFDLMLTGDEYLVLMALDAQSDALSLMSDLVMLQGRHDITVYKHLENSTFTDCVTSSVTFYFTILSMLPTLAMVLLIDR
ncbi:hypothetical protein KIN20_032219 [Parelaphostrongylus tenuis]|uniref:Repulsive guidance molecule C-terminal domain-containing protein n=1 Tax=Parelaphostrongylus tenuis TaxID=148309 RepID=A0AAD5WHW3_PARTN|nr:hypothetical protein KIN20_032219 [Parelaphostrongylus tenuis]